MHDERTDPSMYYSTEPWFVRHRLYPERTKTFVFGFVIVFVMAHEQSISTMYYLQSKQNKKLRYAIGNVKSWPVLIWLIKSIIDFTHVFFILCWYFLQNASFLKLVGQCTQNVTLPFKFQTEF